MESRVTHDDVSPALKALAALARDKQPILRAMGSTFKSITEGTFNSVGASYRPIPWKAKRDGTPSNLQSRTPVLSKSFALAVTTEVATVSTPCIYGPTHQFGATILPKKGTYLKMNIPGVGWRSVKKVVIPPRPFFPVLNGQLTPAAQNLITRAGERAAGRQLPGVALK